MSGFFQFHMTRPVAPLALINEGALGADPVYVERTISRINADAHVIRQSIALARERSNQFRRCAISGGHKRNPSCGGCRNSHDDVYVVDVQDPPVVDESRVRASDSTARGDAGGGRG